MASSPDQPIPAALTPEEWARFEFYDGLTRFDAQLEHRLTMKMLWDGSYVDLSGRRGALAALCLYQQPFGFTQDDALFLTQVAADHANGHQMAGPRPARAAHLESLATRIAALLPPPPTSP